jgi:TonB-linked SusC/RagA family outer membrane protein
MPVLIACNHTAYCSKQLFMMKTIYLLFIFFIPASLIAQSTKQGLPNESSAATAQNNISLSGKIIDERTKTALIGATVQIKGTTHEVVTDNNGEFKFITGQKIPVIYIISYVGYQTQEVYADNVFTNITLKESKSALNDVVVVGYGTQKRTDITGSVASVSKNILNQPAASFDNLLQGSVPGVTVTQSSGQPGATATIRVRGGNSISFGNDPLYVIDGFIIYNNNNYVNTGAATGPAINALSTINPSDIETIDILKDASATAIYGSHGANGVVIITTKRGRKGSTDISYSNYLGDQTVAKKLSLLNASQWGALVNDINVSDGKPKTYSDSALAALGVGSDWQSAALRSAFQQNHELSISGGDDKSRFLISGNYYDQDGIILNSGFKRYNGRINYERNLTSAFKISTNIFGSRSLVNAPFGGINVNNASSSPSGGFSNLLFTSPAAPVKNADGSYNTTNPLLSSTNPIQDIESTINQTNVTRVLANIAGEYRITKELLLKVTLGTDLINSKQNYYSPTYAGSPAGNSTGYAVSGYAAVGTSTATTWLNENTLTFDHTFSGKHFFTALAGYTTQSEKGETAVASAQKFANNLTTYNNLASAGTANLPTSSSQAQVLNSFLGRVSYSYLHKYNITLSERADGASQLGTNNKWGYFPSVGLSWNVDKENFFRHFDGVISTFKLRLTAGQTGNSNIPPYSSLPTLTPSNYYFGNPQTLATGVSPNQLGNNDLKWETTTQYNAGIDAALLHNRINLTFDVYYKKTTDLLLNVPLPLYTGYATRLENIGSVENKGIEIGLNTQNISGRNFGWTSAFVFAVNRNKVLSLEPGVNSYFPTAPIGLVSPVIVQVGLPVGSFWGYSTDGLLTQADLDKGVPLLAGVSQQVGDRKYLPLHSGTTVITAADKHYLGSAQPKFTASFSNTINYKGFDFIFFFQGAEGNKLFNQLNQNLERPTLTTNGPATQLDRWSTTNTNGTMPKATNAPVTQVTDRYVEDASYIKLKNVSLGYSFPSSIISKIRVTKLRVYVSAQNLLTITKYTGFDPESNYFDSDNTKAGIDYGIYPSAKTFLAGLSISF